LLAAGPAGAQSPSPEAMAAARELIVTMRAADYFKTLMPAIMQQLKPAIVQNRPQVERDYDAIVPLLLDSMNARVNEIIDQIAAVTRPVLAERGYRDGLIASGFELPPDSSPERMRSFVEGEIARWTPIMKVTNFRLE